MAISYKDITKSALWTVSTVKGGYAIGSMFDGNLDTFWQSDAIPPHWIGAQFSKETYVSKLTIFLSIQHDDTYTPIEMVVHVGHDPTVLTEYRRLQPGVLQGWFEIDLSVSTIFLKISILKNQHEGRDSRIRQMRLFGAPYSPCIDPTVCFLSPELTQYLCIR
jgi:anaphase-promoting complex subunit 10